MCVVNTSPARRKLHSTRRANAISFRKIAKQQSFFYSGNRKIYAVRMGIPDLPRFKMSVLGRNSVRQTSWHRRGPRGAERQQGAQGRVAPLAALAGRHEAGKTHGHVLRQGQAFRGGLRREDQRTASHLKSQRYNQAERVRCFRAFFGALKLF